MPTRTGETLASGGRRSASVVGSSTPAHRSACSCFTPPSDPQTDHPERDEQTADEEHRGARRIR